MYSRDPMSSDQMLATLTDDETLSLTPGEAVIVQTPRGLAPLIVERVRPGVAYTDGSDPQPYEVPVVEARGLVWAAGDLLLPAVTAGPRSAPSVGGVSLARPSNRVGGLRDGEGARDA